MVGMESVAKEVDSLIAYSADVKRREDAGLPVKSATFHLVLSGNPGTGKTTVATDIARLYNALGILPKPTVTTADAGSLIGEYANQTEQNVTKLFANAKGGVVLVDEAYQLADSEEGRRAATQLMKLMEENKDDTAVIIAGYPGDLQRLISVNPGFARRFPRTINFPDYKPADQVKILSSMMKQNKDRVDSDETTKYLMKAVGSVAKLNQNAGGIRNLHEQMGIARATRLADRPFDEKALSTFTIDDVNNALDRLNVGRPKDGKLVKKK